MPKPDRNERLAEQLRANLKKRKQQERARKTLLEAPERDAQTSADAAKSERSNEDRSAHERQEGGGGSDGEQD